MGRRWCSRLATHTAWRCACRRSMARASGTPGHAGCAARRLLGRAPRRSVASHLKTPAAPGFTGSQGIRSLRGPRFHARGCARAVLAAHLRRRGRRTRSTCTRSVNCVESVFLRDAAGKETRLEWKSVKPDELELRLPLQEASAGLWTLLVRQYGQTQPQGARAACIHRSRAPESFTLHAGDLGHAQRATVWTRSTSSLSRVWSSPPGPSAPAMATMSSRCSAPRGRSAVSFKQGDGTKARVALKDGRAFEVGVAIDAPRPSASLIGKLAQSAATAAPCVSGGSPHTIGD